MRGKIIATILALVMVSTAFALVVPSVSAQPSHLWVTSSDGGATGNIANAADTTSPSDGLARHYIQTRPGEVILGATAPNPPTSHDRVGLAGTSGTSNMAQIDSEGFTTPSANADPTIFIVERDTTAPVTALFPVSVQISSMAGGNVPNGYVASAPVYSFLWAEPLGYGCFGASTLTKIPTPAVPTAVAVSWTAIAGVPNVYGYGVLEGTSSSGPWTEIGQSTGTTLACSPVQGRYYSLVIYWAGTGAGFLNTQAVRGAVFGAPVLYPLSASTYGPEVQPGTTETGVVLTGNVSNEFVTISCTVTDTEAPADNVGFANIEIPTGGTVYNMTTGSPVGSSRVFTYQYDLPNGQLVGLVNYRIRGWDNADGWGNWTADSYSYTDTTKPLVAWNSQPGATSPFNAALNFAWGYIDFATYDVLVANSYFRYRINALPWVTSALPGLQTSFAYGSFMYSFGTSIPGSTGANGDVITYEGRIQDANGNFQLLSTGTVTLTAAASAVQDPYPIFGRLYLYNGNGAGAWAPILSGAGTVVTARWIHSLSGLPVTNTDTTNALGQFSIDLLNYTTLTRVELSATFAAPFGNQGHNWTTIDIAGVPGGRYQDVICGVPYQVIYNPAIVNLTNVFAGVPYPVTYQIVDRDGGVCQGYYSTAVNLPMNFFTGDPLFVNGVGHPLTYDGDGGATTDGFWSGTVTFATAGVQYLNISEGGRELPVPNNFPTPWGAFTQWINGVQSNGYRDDYQNNTVTVVSGAFQWNLVIGWNQVCVPMNPNNDGGNLIFGAFDATREIWQDLGGAGYSVASRTGGNPSNYVVFDNGSGEGSAFDFAMDYVHGYWVFSTRAGIVTIMAQNVSNVGVDNVVTLTNGWNLLGFTHNYSAGGAQAGGWFTQPTALRFATGLVDPDLDIAGANTQIIATWWVQATQWYNSYVYTDTFPGMATHNWVYNTQFAYGYFIWSDGLEQVTFNLNY